jgi:hypothetical protein
MEIKGVSIGDNFKKGKSAICQVIDFRKVTSMKTGDTIGYQCIAIQKNGWACNVFEVPFTTVLRNKLKETV